jgi:hypothetical protein
VPPKLAYQVLALLLATFTMARGQEAVSSITQARLFANPSAPGTTSYDANGTALAEDDATNSGDDSFGTQIVLKNQERPRTFNLFGNVAAVYTNNVDLTPDATRGDVFMAANVGAVWTPTIARGLVAEVSAASSVFRYDRAAELDFERIAAGTGLSWLVPHTPGIIVFGRYDFTELLDSGSNELLRDHAFTVGAQKIFPFGRSHYFSAGISGVLGLSTPRSEERNQAGVYGAYHFQITRSFDADLLYRYAAQFYEEGDRFDRNQTLSLAMACTVTRWLRIGASISAARNDSDQPAFDYDVFNLGGELRLNVSF